MEVVKFFPGVDFTLDSIEMVFPYAPLYHYFTDMQKYVRNDQSEDCKVEDFQVLEWYHDNHLVDHYNEVRSFIGLSNVSFENLWAIFRPGDLVVTRDHLGLPQLHVLAIAETVKKPQESYRSLRGSKEQDLVVKAWSMVWSPARRTFRRALWAFVIPQFRGSRGVTSLEVYPLGFDNAVAQKELQEKLIKRGNIWKKLVAGRPTCWHYKGAAFDRGPSPGPSGPPGSSQKLYQTINVS